MTDSPSRPILALTMGDPVGVGPEIIVKTLADARIYRVCRPLIIGDLPALDRARLALDPALKIQLADRPGAGRYQSGTLDLMPLSQLASCDLEYGRPTPASGEAMVGYILAAIDLALMQKVSGLVTAPISKIAMKLSGYAFPGHTELLAERTKTPEFAMMLAGGNFRVVLATIHCALAEVPKKLTQEGLVRLFHLTAKALDRDFGLAGVPLGVAALNPHASEAGMFGHEEEAIIIPAVKEAQAAGLAVEGPFPADTLFWRHNQGEFAAIICMYHDQGLIPLKLLHFMDGVNVTLGLPIIRTSVDHGTAYNLAGTGKAAPDSLKAAIMMAAEMAKRRFGGKE
ncbi:MAG: 4-hydroxythreonine-4-phosphate dehydrogenase PdxA [Desulfobaccales bacterium]